MPDSLEQVAKLEQLLCEILKNFPTEDRWREYVAGVREESFQLEEESISIIQRNKPAPRTGFIYLMRNNRNGLVKIGFSRNPKFREATLQSEEPEVELIESWPGNMDDEAALHENYALCRVRGEWFRLTPADIASIIK